MTESTQTPKLFSALVKAQLSARAVEKDAKNEHHKYRYASAESMIEEGRTALATNGLALLVTHVDLTAGERTEKVNRDSGEVSIVDEPPFIRATYVLAHESGESLTYIREWPCILQKGRPLDKAQGGALTTALAYAIRDVLMLPRDDEYAAMDRRDDTDHDPDRRRQALREPPREEHEEAAESQRRPAERREEPAANDGGGGAGGGGESFDELLAAIRRGESIAARIEATNLPTPSRVALAFVSRAYKAATVEAFAKIGAEIRRSDALTPALREIALTEIRPAWDALQKAAS